MYKLWTYPDPIDSAGLMVTDQGYVISGVSEFNDITKRDGMSFTLPAGINNGWGCNIRFTHPTYTEINQRGILYVKKEGFQYPWSTGQTAAFAADDFKLAKGFRPDPPTRAEVLGVNMHFRGGLVVNSLQYGKMPWWPTALSWMDLLEDRQEVYRVSREAGDTHQIIQIPNGKPLYNDPNQFYNATKFGPRDWTNGMTALDSRFTDLVNEVISNGFIPLINMDEVFSYSIQIVRMVMRALDDYQAQFCLTLPGYDGVFYGWEPSNELIPFWASEARKIKPNCYLGIEFNPGHIPLGNGPSDYEIGGLMDGYDAIFAEYPSLPPMIPPQASDWDDANKVWQVTARMVKPYHRPKEQPDWDDPNPPFYLVDSPRGPRTFVGFETWNPYNWVRVNIDNDNDVKILQANIEEEREYMKSLGISYIG